jgi:hypothetical protein
MRELELTAAMTRDGSWFVARCLEVEVASQGHTAEESLANLREARTLPRRPTMSLRGHTRPPQAPSVSAQGRQPCALIAPGALVGAASWSRLPPIGFLHPPNGLNGYLH